VGRVVGVASAGESMGMECERRGELEDTCAMTCCGIDEGGVVARGWGGVEESGGVSDRGVVVCGTMGCGIEVEIGGVLRESSFTMRVGLSEVDVSGECEGDNVCWAGYNKTVS